MDPQGFEDGPGAKVLADTEEISEGAVGQLNPPGFVEQEQAFGHAVENGFLLGLELGRGGLVALVLFCEFGLRSPAQLFKSASPPQVQRSEAPNGQYY
jgi:hypothetical protein